MTTENANSTGAAVTVAVAGLQLFLLVVVGIAISHGLTLFLDWHQGKSHRLVGAALLAWLAYGAGTCCSTSNTRVNALLYDTVLGVLGIGATLTAARDFPHKYVKNAQGQSGSLSPKALVTQAEMMEHSFYQGLNLMQAWYLHGMSHYPQHDNYNTNNTYADVGLRLLALWLVTVPWYWRKYFPVHSFSNNWKITPKHQRTDQEVLFYRIKKTQYMFYKHVLLHGLNISVARAAQVPIMATSTSGWRIYWLALNTSYAMEFFLQSMMRRHIISARTMFALQRLLMAASSLAALNILFVGKIVQPLVCVLSLALNLGHRHHDVTNVMMIAVLWNLGAMYYPAR